MSRQQNINIKKKSHSKLFTKIIFPLNNYHHQIQSKYNDSQLYLHHHQQSISHQHQPSCHQLLCQSSNIKQSNTNTEISKINRIHKKKQSFSQLNKLIQQFQKTNKKQFINQFNLSNSINTQNHTLTNHLPSKFKQLSQNKHRSLSKPRSLTINNPYQTTNTNNRYENNNKNLNNVNTQQNNPFTIKKTLKSSSKHRSLTKMQSNWIKGRDKQKQKQIKHLHKFDQQKIDRNYDHLGKLRKKITHNQQQIKSRFASFKNLPKEINQIDKETFQNAKKDFNKKFKTYPLPKPEQDQSQLLQKQEQQLCLDQQTKKLSPKVPKKNFLKINPLFNTYKKQNLKGGRNKGEKKVFRVSADLQLLKLRPQLGSQPEIDFEDNDHFYSQIEQFGSIDQNEEQKERRNRNSSNQTDSNISSASQLNLQRARVSQNQQTSIFDKVYFFSLKLSAGFASLFTIQRINLKSRSGGNFIIQVVICAYQQILVQRIKFDKQKRFETMKRLKPTAVDKNYEKEKLKYELFGQLMARKQEQKNRQSDPVSVEFNSQKTNFYRKSQSNFAQSEIKNFTIHSIQQQYEANESQLRQEINAMNSQMSLINFTKVSPQSYQLIIDYLQKFCQLQISYLGASLKQSDSQTGMINQLMKKKHSQIQQTLLQSLNLARVFYFLIKINATYYVSKSVIIANRKIKHYLLYEFSNMIRHQKQCIIQQQQDINQSIKNMKNNCLVQWLYKKVNKFFTQNIFKKWKQRKSVKNNQSNYNQFKSQQYPLINALQLCFGTLANVGMKCQYSEINSQRLFKIIQSNYKNDIRWKKISFQINNLSKDQTNNTEPFFQFHNAFDFGISMTPNRDSFMLNTYSNSKQASFLFISPLSQAIPSHYPEKLTNIFSYTISRNFFINITLYPSNIKSRDQIIKLHVRTIKEIKIQDQFRKQQFALLHLGQNFDNHKKCQILQHFLKQQYVTNLIKNNKGLDKVSNVEQQHLFTIIKNKKYHIHVFIAKKINMNKKQNILQQKLKIQAQSRLTVKHYTLQPTLGDIFAQIKQFHRLYSDGITYHKFSQTIKRIKTHSYDVSKKFIIDKIKFYVSKLLLMKKNTYSQFYFVPLPSMVSEASIKASFKQTEKQTQNEEKSLWGSSILINSIQKKLIFQCLQKLQDSLQEKQKHSLTAISKITIKNFPIYEIYYKAVRKLIPGHFVVVSIYYMPMFDLSQVKVYVNRIRKSFWTSIKRDAGTIQHQKIVNGVVQFIKEKYFGRIIRHETEKLSSKYRDFYSQMIKQAQTPFLCRARKNKEVCLQTNNLNTNFKTNLNRRRQRQPTRKTSSNPYEFAELTQQLLCKLFNSPRRNKYIIRLSYPATGTYVHENERKGIDELINISVLKQNCMLIYKFQTTARKLLAKKVTHKYNVIQLEYQQKNKPFYILFEEIKTLISKSDQTTYGLLNTFRGYFLDKHYNNLATTSFVSMLSLNLLAGVTNQNLSQSENNLSDGNNQAINKPQQSISQKKFAKDLNSNIYQRYCLFVQDNKILQVLKVRDKFQKKSLMQSDRNIPSSKSHATNLSKQFVKRRADRKQSIQAFLVEKNDFLQSSIKPSNKKNGSYQSRKIDFILEESYYINQHSDSNEKLESNYEQKIVYLIDTETEAINEIPSSVEDQGFMINIPFGKYNRKMFKRFFKHYLLVRAQNEAHQNKINGSNNKINSTSVLSVPEINRYSFRSNNFNSQQTFFQ